MNYLGQFVKYTLFGSPFLLPRVPHWVPISLKIGSPLGLHEKNLGPHSMWEQCRSHGVNFWVRCASGNVFVLRVFCGHCLFLSINIHL